MGQVLEKSGKCPPWIMQGAKRIVLMQFPNARLREIELETEDGRLVYEVELTTAEGRRRNCM